MVAPRASIIVVNYNGKRFLGACLDSLRAQTYPNFEIIVVDNGSGDGSADFVAAFYPEVRLERNATNLGFAAGNNVGIASSTGEYIATINNDTIAEPAWLEELVRPLQNDLAVGSCASKMLFLRDPGVINSAGIAVDVVGIAWDRKGGEVDSAGEEPCEVFGACAGAAAYRRTMLDLIGIFDPDFFAYLEDVDLAWRARLAGWRCTYVPTARVLHYHSGTAVEGSKFKNRLLGRNKVWTILKNYPLPQFALFFPAIVAFDLMSVVHGLARRRDGSGLLGRIEAIGRLFGALQKRSQIQKMKRATWTQLNLAKLETPLGILRRYSHLDSAGGAR